ncbi:MAG: hypothetical protein RR424_03845 [Oscillospiraceae bacterium]
MNKKTALKLFASCYIIVAMFLVASSLFAFLQDSIYFFTGKIKYTDYPLHSLITNDIELTGADTFVTVGVDSQLIIKNYDAPATTLILDMKYDKYPGEVNLYYTRKEGDYSVQDKVYATQRNDGSYAFALPRGRLHDIRVDPTCFKDINIELEHFIINPKISFLNYFTYSGDTIFNYFVVTGLFAAFIAWCISAVNACPKLKSKLDKIIFSIKRKLGKHNG